MIYRTWQLLAIAFVILLLIDPQDAHASSKRIKLAFEVYGGGLHLASLNTDTVLHEDKYSISSRFDTRGMLSWFRKGGISSRVNGARNPDGVRPRNFSSISDGKWRGRAIDIVFRENGTVTSKFTANNKHGSRELGRDDLGADALDPLTALWASVMERSPQELCTQPVPIFDGRRLYRVEFADVVEVDPPQLKFARIAGPVKRCDVIYRRVAGFDGKKTDKEPARVTLWLGKETASDIVVPLRLESETRWGVVVGRLTGIQVGGI